MKNHSSSRRNFLRTTALVGGMGLLGARAVFAAAETQNTAAPTLKGKKLLFVYGGWEGHEPGPSRDFFVPLLEKEGAIVTVSDNLDSYLDENLMSSTDLIVQAWTMGQITGDQEKGLINAVRNGCGIAGWHGGTGDSFRNNTEYQFMIGGQFVSHPGGIIRYKVNITDKDDYVTRGLNDFDIRSEQYYLHVDPNIKVLATTTFTGDHAGWIDGAVIPQVWKKYHGKGRVFYSALGHTVPEFKVHEIIEITMRGLRWAAESRYQPQEKWVNPVYR